MIQPLGYLKLWRELFSKPIWKKSTPEQKTILITLLGMVNFSANQWEWKGEKYEVQPGQVVTSAASIIENCGQGITRQNVRTSLERFRKLEFLTYESTKTGILVTIENWGYWQGNGISPNQETNQDLTKTQPTANQDLTTIKERKNNKNDMNVYDELFESLWTLYPNKKGKGQVSAIQKKKLYDIGFDELSRCIERYKKAKESWKEWQHGSTFFNSGYVDYLDKNTEKSKPIQPIQIVVKERSI